jgi:complement component 1 Q subcomponent-binding protein
MLQPDAKFDSFTVDDRPGEQWITLKRKFGDEDIKLEVTMFNGAVPTSKSGGSGSLGNEVQLYILLIVNISKGHDVLEIACSAWPDSIEINRLLARHGDKTPARPYTGPEFKYDFFPPLLIVSSFLFLFFFLKKLFYYYFYISKRISLKNTQLN